jgi:hypothetical protein
MKLWLGVMLFVWLLCGVAGAGLLGDHHWKTIAKGPFSLVKGFQEDPPL